MVEQLSPLGSAWEPGSHGRITGGPGVTLSEIRPGTILEAAAWPGQMAALAAAIAPVAGLSLTSGPGFGGFDGGRAAFVIGPNRFLVADPNEGAYADYVAAVSLDIGTITDLSHGRTALRLAGPRAEWVLSKFYAVDFSLAAFPVANGVATTHHDIFTQIQRTGADAFDLYIFRSYARSFWKALCLASEEVGYEVR